VRLTSITEKHALGVPRLALLQGSELRALPAAEVAGPGLFELLGAGDAAMREAASTIQRRGVPVDEATIRYLPLVSPAAKIICVGLNYVDHTEESNFKQPDYPTIFARFPSSMIGHLEPIVLPRCSSHLDFEGEMAVYIGKGGRHIPRARTLDHVAGYAVCNDASIRDYQFRTPQWTIGKNFDGTGPLGPFFVSADEVPAGGAGLAISTRLNGETVQAANTRDMVFDVATLIALVSEAMTLAPGDVIVSGTPAGVGFVRKPPLWMKHGDCVEVEIEGIGLLRNPVQNEA
jgi:acylpyruvate hydrolase